MILKILSFNIWIESKINKIEKFLLDANADIIGLQEVENDDPKRNIVEFLKEQGYQYAFAPVRKEWGGNIYNDGPAIFSRYDILGHKTFLLSKVDKRAAIEVDIQVENKVIHVFSTHLIHDHQKDTKTQREQGANLIKEINPNKTTIVMGDFNATPESWTIRAMQKVLLDTDPLSLPTWSTTPEGCIVCKPKELNTRLDYIFTSRDVKTKSFKVESSSASDHLPISAILQI